MEPSISWRACCCPRLCAGVVNGEFDLHQAEHENATSISRRMHPNAETTQKSAREVSHQFSREDPIAKKPDQSFLSHHASTFIVVWVPLKIWIREIWMWKGNGAINSNVGGTVVHAPIA